MSADTPATRDMEAGALTASTDVVPPAADSVAQRSDAGEGGGAAVDAAASGASDGRAMHTGNTLHAGDSASVALGDDTGGPGSAAASAAAASRRRRRKKGSSKARAGAREPVTPRTLRGRPEWNGDIELPAGRYETTLSQRVSRRRNLRRQRLLRRRMQRSAKAVRGAPNRRASGDASVGSQSQTTQGSADSSSVGRGSDGAPADGRRGAGRGSWGTISLTSEAEADESGRISALQSPGPPCTTVSSGIETAVQTEGDTQVPPLQMSASGAASRRRGKRSPAQRRNSGRLRVGRPATADAAGMTFSAAAATVYQPYAASLHSMRSTRSGSRSMPSTPLRRSRSTPAHLMYSPHHHYDGSLRRKRPGLASSAVLSKSMTSRRPRDFYSKQPAIFSSYSLSKFQAPPAYSMGAWPRCAHAVASAVRLTASASPRVTRQPPQVGAPNSHRHWVSGAPGPGRVRHGQVFRGGVRCPRASASGPPRLRLLTAAAACGSTLVLSRSRTPPRVTFGHRTPLPDPDRSPRPAPGGTYSIPSFTQESIKAQKGATFGQRLKSKREIAIACGCVQRSRVRAGGAEPGGGRAAASHPTWAVRPDSPRHRLLAARTRSRVSLTTTRTSTAACSLGTGCVAQAGSSVVGARRGRTNRTLPPRAAQVRLGHQAGEGRPWPCTRGQWRCAIVCREQPQG